MPSKQAQIIERTMRRLNLKEQIASRTQNVTRKNFHYEEPNPSFRVKHPVQVYKIGGFKCVFTATDRESKPDQHIMYFHGGSYKNPAMRTHWHIIDSIISRTNTELTFVNYPLAPENKCTDTIRMVSDTYNHIVDNYSKNIILMGDSAGGGLALALAEYLEEINHDVKPKKLVLLSPWLDISMDNDISIALQNRDLILDKNALRLSGERYAGDMDMKNYLCSPLYGNLENLAETAIFIGTNDILYSQCELLKEKMKKANIPLSYYPYDEMHHVWVGYPIPEAREAFEDIAEFLNK